ncbi:MULTISPECIES: hypothetical protein [unclassified Streptomyces]|uniref:hypothetical protein n=1 Tax=unclassified Streptomyces TaxID=2593676 RepID=UPI000A87BC0A|nr:MULTISPECIES: hypothetical protein [unclassified Streptomyces]
MITADLQHCAPRSSPEAGGELDEGAGESLRQASDDMTTDERDLLVDRHGAAIMDADGPLRLPDVHQRAERLGLRVLVTGRQPQPQQRMAEVTGIRRSPPRPPGSSTPWPASAGSSRSGTYAHGTLQTSPPGWLPRA